MCLIKTNSERVIVNDGIRNAAYNVRINTSCISNISFLSNVENKQQIKGGDLNYIKVIFIMN